MFFVYVDYTQDTLPRPFYVGKGTSIRVRATKRNIYHTRVAKKHGWYRVVVNSVLDEQEAFGIERQLIRMLGTRDYRGGCNLTDGGEGMSGLIVGPKTRAKLSAARAGKRRPPFSPEAKKNMAAAQRGKKAAPETRAKMSAAHLGKKCPRRPEQQEKISVAHIGKKLSPEHRAKISAANRGKKMPPKSAETLARMSAAQIGKTLSPKHRAKLSAAGLGRKMPAKSEETLAKMSKAQMGKKLSPEHRAKISAALLETYAERRNLDIQKSAR